MKRADYLPYLKTLRRIPKDVRLSMATREFWMFVGWACVCGWAVRDAVLAATGEESVHPAIVGHEGDWLGATRKTFGGTRREWQRIYSGVCDDKTAPAIETAFTIAVMEAAS